MSIVPKETSVADIWRTGSCCQNGAVLSSLTHDILVQGDGQKSIRGIRGDTARFWVLSPWTGRMSHCINRAHGGMRRLRRQRQ
jgi:hypothetical protein